MSPTPDHLALAVLTAALGADPGRLPLAPPTDHPALAAAAASPLLAHARSRVLPPGGPAGAAASSIFGALPTAPVRPAAPLVPGPLSLRLAADGAPAAEADAAGALARDLALLYGRPPLPARALADVLLGLLQRHHWATPNGTGRHPEVPLADAARVQAALAACLGTPGVQPEAPYALVGTDLAGIQAFIYDIASRKAARALKGRSFYLHLLTENFVTALLDRLGLGRAHVVYASGGGAYVLAPHTPTLAATLATLRHELSERLFTEAGTRLFLALAHEPLPEGALFGEALKRRWAALSDRLSAQKRQRFAEKLAEAPELFFRPLDQGGEAEQDAVTGDELRAGIDEPYAALDPDAADEPGAPTRGLVSRFTAQHIRLGSTLRVAEAIDTAAARGAFGPLNDPERVFQPGELPYWNVLPRPDDGARYARTPGTRADLLNQPDFLSRPGATGFQLYGGNDYPRDEHDPAAPRTYDQLAGPATAGFRRLGILRMDVDSLGKQFVRGFRPAPGAPENTRSLAHFVTLSRALDWFFKGYLNTLWKADPAFRDNLSLVYAGGDDLFVVGRWDAAIRFAAAIQADFRRYTGGALTLSGGVAVVPPRFPISRAASLAEAEEKRAKGHTAHGEAKNAFSFLGTAVHWQHEWPVVQHLHHQLTALLGSGQLPRSVLRRIYEYAELHRTGSLKWRWQMAYDFGRLRERLNRSPEAQAWLEALEHAAITGIYAVPDAAPDLSPKHPRFLDLLTLAARWAELALRTEGQK